ncbi:MAG: S1-like domain-containing RNA-binding protein [Mariprofundaceae bacterium]
MVDIGEYNTLKVVKEVDFGIYLDGGELGEILLPIRYVPKNCKVDDKIKVFIYHDSENRIIATTDKPYATVGEFACLKVVAVNKIGAFLDWGLMKDLLLPFSEQLHEIEEGKRYVVGVYLDENTHRVAASAKLNDFLYDESDNDFETGEEVSMFVANKTDMGYKIIVNNSHWGLLHHQEIIQEPKRGEKLKGFIKNIREDGKIDLCLHQLPSEKTDDVVEMILKQLKKEDGFLMITDKSLPEEIEAKFSVSKVKFKKAIGALYKKKKITLEKDGIRLVE